MLARAEALIERGQADDEPAPHLTDEHLRRLNHGLLKVLPLLGARRLAVPHALHVLSLV